MGTQGTNSAGGSANQCNFMALSCCGVILATFILALAHDSGTAFSQDYDEGVYLTSARSVVSGEPLFTSVFSSQPPLFVTFLATAFSVFGDSVATGRNVIVGFAAVSLLASGFIAWRLAGSWAAVIAMGGLALAPHLFTHARSCQAEIPSLAFSQLAIVALLHAEGRARLGFGALGGALFALAALTKLLVAPVILPLVALAYFRPDLLPVDGQAPAPKAQRLKLLGAFLGGGLLMSGLVLLQFDLMAVYDQAVRFHTQARSGGFTTSNGAILAGFFANSSGLVILGLIGLIQLAAANLRAFLWLGLWIAVSLLFLVAHQPLFPRHCILLLLPLSVAAGASLILWRTLWKTRALRILVVLAGIGGLGLVEAPGSRELRIAWLWQHDRAALREDFDPQESKIIELIRSRTSPSDLVVSDQQMQVFRAGRNSAPVMCDTSLVRIAAGYLTDDIAIAASQKARMVVFTTGRLSRLTGYTKWVTENFQLIHQAGPRKVYLRRESRPER